MSTLQTTILKHPDSASNNIQFDSSGRVGVGTSPAHAVHIAGATTPELIVEDTTNNVKAVVGADNTVGRIGTDTNHELTLRTNDIERVRVDTLGRVGIGTEDPQNTLHLFHPTTNVNLLVESGDANAYISFKDNATTSSSAVFIGAEGNDFKFHTNGLERARINSDGRLLVGTSSATDNTRLNQKLGIVSNSGSSGGIRLTQNPGTIASAAPIIDLRKTRGSTDGGHTIVANNDNLGYITFGGADGTDNESLAALITAQVDGTPGTNDMPGRLVFSTTADGASSPTERVRIDSSGHIKYFGNSSSAWLLSPASNAASYSQLDAHFPASNRTVFFNENTSNDSYVVWNRNSGSSGKGFGLQGQNFKVVQGSSEQLRIDNSGNVGIKSTNPLAQLHILNSSGTNGFYLSRTNGTTLGDTVSLRITTDASKSRIQGYGDALTFWTAAAAGTASERMRIESGGASIFSGTVAPETDNTHNVGGASLRWAAIYAANGTIQTSDQREKTNILDSSLGVDFIKSLRPVSYKWINGGQVESSVNEEGELEYTSHAGQRTHWGFIAQEVKQSVDDAGVDFGGWVLTDKDDSDSQQALRYDQFIAPLTKALQEAIAKIETLEAKVAALEAK